MSTLFVVLFNFTYTQPAVSLILRIPEFRLTAFFLQRIIRKSKSII